MIDAPTSDLAPATTFREPHRHSPDEVLAGLGSDARQGLTTTEVEKRRASTGRNELDATVAVPAWRRLLHQFTDRLILILIGAAVVAFVVSGELKTPLVVLVVVVLNALLGFVQENRAERSLDALRRLVVLQARVRRDGAQLMLDATELVPGDIVLVEAGDRIPADGRLVMASNLELDEAILTGESQPVAKTTEAVDADGVGIGDRTCMAHMNTTATRGRGELVVTATGMQTEIGRIAGLIGGTANEKTPLQRQLDQLAGSLARLAGLIVVAVVVIGLIRGQSISDLLLTSVALAVAAIPEGLPAVTAVTLAIGVSNMARRNAIVKRLASVETLGCTSVICSDKTGTLTLNQMTAVELYTGGVHAEVSGRGYGPEGAITSGDRTLGADDPELSTVFRAIALCNDASVRRAADAQHDDEPWQLVGDPTEGALVVLAAKAGVDVEAVRAERPRLAELPFDSATKLMATAHEFGDSDPAADSGVEILVKGAPDVLLERSTDVDDAAAVERTLEHMAARGLRVLAVARRTMSHGDFADTARGGGDLADTVNDLTLLALVGIVDPPRQEAADAIREAATAGIDVKMITGDHVATAGAIAGQLGLSGEVISGRDLDALSDDELARRIGDISVFARVSPDHKLRVVDALQRRGDVVAMTGDGVNDAPALKKADMGVAMGITGTEVTKEAATMILTDDNFATIVEAVRRGRTIYANIVKFVRFQLSTTIGFASLFLLAGLLGIADGKPFTAIAILWVNLVMDGPPAMALGIDKPGADVMQRRPRPLAERILTRPRWIAVGTSAAVMAIGTLAVLAWAPGAEPVAGSATVAGTMAFNTFVLFQFFNILNVRSDDVTVFHRSTLGNRWLWMSLAVVILLQVGVTHFGPLQSLFDTTSISGTQWLVCAAVASSVLWVEELRKLISTRIGRTAQ